VIHDTDGCHNVTDVLDVINVTKKANVVSICKTTKESERGISILFEKSVKPYEIREIPSIIYPPARNDIEGIKTDKDRLISA
jgi:hypothetical protein